MEESKTYICDSNINNIVTYEIDDNGIIYKSDNAEKIDFNWRDIAYIEDGPRNRILIYLNNSKEVPIHYTTNDFTELLKVICLKLSEIRKDDFRPQKFIMNFKYLCQLGTVIILLFLSLILSLTVSKILFVLFFTLIIPLVIFFQRHPISLTLDNDKLVLLYLFNEKTTKYNNLHNIEFNVINSDYGRMLSVEIYKKNNDKLIIKKFGNMIMLFIMLQIKLNESN